MSQPEPAIRWHKRYAIQRFSRLVDRITNMGLPEVTQRLRLRARRIPGLKQRYRRDYLQQTESIANTFVDACGDNPLSTLSRNLDQRFLYGPSARSGIVDAINEHCPNAKKRTLRIADELLDGRMTLLGQRLKIDNGTIDWHADPKLGANNWPLDFMDENEAITMTSQDVKFVWEINRHQFIPLLGRAYWLSGDERYAQAAKALLVNWIEQNPAGKGVNWCSHLEVAMRAISWLWAMPLLLDSKVVDATFVRTWLGSLAQHYFHLSRNLSLYTDPTNHLIGETTALWLLTSCLPELPDAEQENLRSHAILLQQLELQTHSDGINKEQASSYHRFVTDFYLQFLCVCRKQSRSLPDHLVELIEKKLEYCAALAGTHGTVPMIGDSDDARGIPMPEYFGWNFGDTVVAGAVLFERVDLAPALIPISDPVIWLNGCDSVVRHSKLSGARRQHARQVFESGGMSFLSNPSGKAELIFDVGGLGLWPNASHGHADALGVMARINGRLLIADAGTGTYFESTEHRNWFRGTSAHNTVTVDGLDQADIHGTFKWVNPFESRIEEQQINDNFAYVVASHSGYTRLRDAVVHRRSILSVSMNGWIIVDELSGDNAHSVERNFHFPPDVSCKTNQPGLFEIEDPQSGDGFRIYLPLVDMDDSALPCLDGDGQYSDRYGSINKAPRLWQRWQGQLPKTLVAIVDPFEGSDPDSRRPTYSTIRSNETGSLVILRSDEWQEQLILINPGSKEVALPRNMLTNASLMYVDTKGDNIEQVFIRGARSAFSAPGFGLECDEGRTFRSYSDIGNGAGQ